MIRLFNRVRDGVLEKRRKILFYLGLEVWYLLIGMIVEYGLDYDNKKQGEGIIGGLVTGLAIIALLEVMLRCMPRSEQAQAYAEVLRPEIPMQAIEASRVRNPDGQYVIAIEDKIEEEEERTRMII